ncbi:MAG TPA: pyridoxal phosphate-dependent aminotransferase family protein [Cytophagaceae bacterium]
MERLKQKLQQRLEEGNYRSLTVSENLTDFFSNDYLGLSRNEELKKIIEAKSNNLGWSNGATGSRLLSGNSQYIMFLESKLARLFQAESCLVFNSGYNANLSILSSVPQKGDTIIYDELIHASLKDGARLSFADRYSFKHNNIADLEAKLQKATGKVFVVAETVYSMDGDFCPLKELTQLCEQYHAYLILDEAHSTGVFGKDGNGLICEAGLHDKVFARIYTFGKGMGVHGACIAGSQLLIDYLVNFARPFIYTTALPYHSYASIESAFDYLKHNGTLQSRLKNIIAYFKLRFEQEINKKDILIGSDSSIQVLKIRGNKEAKELAAYLRSEGMDVRAILAPTVKAGEERLRICLHVYNTEEEIDILIRKLKDKVA